MHLVLNFYGIINVVHKLEIIDKFVKLEVNHEYPRTF